MIQRAKFFLYQASVLGLCMVLFACAKSSAKNPNDENEQDMFVGQVRENEIKHEPCETKGRVEKLETPNLWSSTQAYVANVYQGNRKLCSFSDLNGDGRVDLYTYFDDQGRVQRREASYRLLQTMDEISLYKNGELEMVMRETTNDGKIDTWDFYERGQLRRRERDKNGDGRIDEWWQFETNTATITPADPITGKPNTTQRVQVAVEIASGKSAPTTQPMPASSTSVAPKGSAP